MDAAGWTSGSRCPDDAPALAVTTRLGFESYRDWAPEGWEPPPHALEIRSIRERLRQKTTWCAMAVEPDGEQAGHVGITHAAERERPHVRMPAGRTCGCCSCARRGGAPGWRRACTGSALEEAARQGYETIRLYTPLRRRPRARVLRARGLGAGRRAAFSGAAARARPGRVPSRAVIPDRFFEDAAERSRVSMATRWEPRAHELARRWSRPAIAVAARVGGRPSGCSGHQSAVLRPGRGRDRARHLLPRARPAGGRARGRGHARRSRSPTCSRYQLGTGVAAARAGGRSSRSGSACSSGPAQLFVNQVAVSAVLVFTVTPPTGGVLVRARARRAHRRRWSRSRSPRSCCPPTRCGSCATPRGPCSTSWPRRSTTSRAALRSRDARRRRGGAGAGARDRRLRRPLLRRHAREPLEPRRMSPARRRARDTVEFYAEAAARIDLAVRNVRVLARGAMRALALDENVPPEVADSLERPRGAPCARWRRAGDRRGASTPSASPPCTPPRPPPTCSRARRTCPCR